MQSLTSLYGKECLESVSMELYALENTGSWDDRENMVCMLTAPDDVAVSVRSAYRGKNPSGIKDFEMVRCDAVTENGDELYELYFGSSYGAGELLSSVGELLYYSSEFGTEFENQY